MMDQLVQETWFADDSGIKYRMGKNTTFQN